MALDQNIKLKQPGNTLRKRAGVKIDIAQLFCLQCCCLNASILSYCCAGNTASLWLPCLSHCKTPFSCP